MTALILDVPEDFTVVSANSAENWQLFRRLLGEHARSCTDIVAMALGRRPLGDATAPLSLAIGINPAAADSPPALEALRVCAMARTSTNGSVGVYDLPSGVAVVTSDVSAGPDGALAAHVAAHLLPSESNVLVTFVAVSPCVPLLPDAREVVVKVAASLQLSSSDAKDEP